MVVTKKKLIFTGIGSVVIYCFLQFVLISCGQTSTEKLLKAQAKADTINAQLAKSDGPDYPILIKDYSNGDLSYSIIQFKKHQYIRFGNYSDYSWGGHYADCPCGKGEVSESQNLSNQVDSTKLSGDNRSLEIISSDIDSLKHIEKTLLKRNQWLKDSLEAAKHHYYGC